jgi:glycerol-3-phosphate acyltransferase PlsX
MGGDFAPKSVIEGSILAYPLLAPDESLVLIGNKTEAETLFRSHDFNPDRIEIIHTDESIGMAETPTKAIQKKPNSSIAIGFELLKQGSLHSFGSAGNTGAMLVGALFSVKTIPGVIRPALNTIVPKLKGGFGVLLDVGVNADCKPESLVQYGMLGKILAEKVYSIKKPRVGLLNIGEEGEKGNLLTQTAFPLMQESEFFDFIGNIEGRDLFHDKADVIVTDGFTGNVVLKLAESFYEMSLLKGFKDEFFDRFNYEQYGGSPILGVNAPVIVGHGISTGEAVKNMILLSRQIILTQLIEEVKEAFSYFVDSPN